MQIVHHLVCGESTVQTFTINSKHTHTHIIKTATEAGSCGPALTCTCSPFLQTRPFHQKYNNRVSPNIPPATAPRNTAKSLLFRKSQAVSLCNFDSKTKTWRLLNLFTVWIQTGSFCLSVGGTLVGSIWFDCCLGIWNYYVLDMWWIHAFGSGSSRIKQLRMWFCTWNWRDFPSLKKAPVKGQGLVQFVP